MYVELETLRKEIAPRRRWWMTYRALLRKHPELRGPMGMVAAAAIMEG